MTIADLKPCEHTTQLTRHGSQFRDYKMACRAASALLQALVPLSISNLLFSNAVVWISKQLQTASQASSSTRGGDAMSHNLVSAYAQIQKHLKRTSLVARVAAILASGPGPVARASTNSSTRSVRGLLPKIPCARLKALPPAINQDHRRIACGQEILQALFCPDAISQLGYASCPPTINSDLRQCEAMSRDEDGDEEQMRLYSQSSNQRSMQLCRHA